MRARLFSAQFQVEVPITNLIRRAQREQSCHFRKTKITGGTSAYYQSKEQAYRVPRWLALQKPSSSPIKSTSTPSPSESTDGVNYQ